MIGAFLQLTASRTRFGSRASLKVEPVALRHQVIVPTWQRHERIRLFSADRLAVPSAVAIPQYPGTRQAGDRDQMAPQRHPHLLAMAIIVAPTQASSKCHKYERLGRCATPAQGNCFPSPV
jgi:hypothetical protein